MKLRRGTKQPLRDEIVSRTARAEYDAASRKLRWLRSPAASCDVPVDHAKA